jgi:hypothetical protein
MESLSFRPGRAFLSSNSSVVPWTVVFEDEGVAGYVYACDRSRETQDEAILDAMLVYNVGSLKEPEKERLATVEWSKDGLRAALYLDGTPQALFDFGQKCGYCRMNFPNFMAERGETWRKESHAWSDAAMERFEAELYGDAPGT